MKTQSWLETLKEKNGKVISRILFQDFTNQEGVTKEFNPKAWERNKNKNPKKPYVQPIVNYYFQKWNEYELIEKSPPLRKVHESLLTNKQKEILRYSKKEYSFSVINFKPIYKFFREAGMEFSEEEEDYLRFLFLISNTRKIKKIILEEFPDDDIINAFMKFYTKNLINKYFFYLRDIRENKEKYKKERQRAEEINNPQGFQIEVNKAVKEALKNTSKLLNLPYTEREIEFDILTIVADDKLLSEMQPVPVELKDDKQLEEWYFNQPNNLFLCNLFKDYIHEIKLRPELVRSVDNKILKALSLLPDF